MPSRLDETARLRLICDTVRHCQSLRDRGASATVYSRALREPIHILWETAGKSKDASAQYRSKASLGLRRGGGELVYDHAIPFNLTQRELLALDSIEPESVRPILERGRVVALITKAEDALLNRLGLQSRMPDGWDGVDFLARYKVADIELTENQSYSREGSKRMPKEARSPKVINSPEEHEKFRACESDVKIICRDLCGLLTDRGYTFDKSWRRDGFSFQARFSPAFKIDPKMGFLRVNAGKGLPISPPRCLVHEGGQPDWLVFSPRDKIAGLSFFAQLIDALKKRPAI